MQAASPIGDQSLPSTSAGANVAFRLRHLCLNALSFTVVYTLANRVAQAAGVQRSLAVPLDAAMPFWPWSIWLYMSSGLFLALSFFIVRSEDAVRVLSQRLLLATAGAGLLFAVLPARFSLPRPFIESLLLRGLFDLLAVFDQPYNQFPSLHVAYAVICWASLRRSVSRWPVRSLLGVWLALVAMSTLPTYQHHLLDVVGGLALGLATLCIRPGARAPNVAFYYGAAALMTLTVGVLLLRQWWVCYLAASLALVAMAYARNDRFFLGKVRGQLPLSAWLLYGPYLLGYRLTWLVVRLRERERPPFVLAWPGVWIGRRLSTSEAAALPLNCSVIDLANELSETPALRTHRYMHFPLLDLRQPPPDAVKQIHAALSAETQAGRPVYMHCAMGYSRCHSIARQFAQPRAVS